MPNAAKSIAATPGTDSRIHMKVYLTFDIEIWCNNWAELDQRFPASFDRYVYGRSTHGDFALPATLRILQSRGLCGVFFVEPLFAARFGQSYLDTVVGMILSAGQDVQLHLHPEWTDEIRPAILPNTKGKRQHLFLYSELEQAELIRIGKHALEVAGAPAIRVFRAGSYAANRATYKALCRNDIWIDSSLNEIDPVSGKDLDVPDYFSTQREIDGIVVYPVTVFTDGLGRRRPAQVGACGFAEMKDALISAQASGCEHFVIVSHNFEMLKSESSEPDWIVVRRFELLCDFLAAQRGRFEVGTFEPSLVSKAGLRPHASALSTGVRWAEQIYRRLA